MWSLLKVWSNLGSRPAVLVPGTHTDNMNANGRAGQQEGRPASHSGCAGQCQRVSTNCIAVHNKHKAFPD